jgi:hypothetical protein
MMGELVADWTAFFFRPRLGDLEGDDDSRG